MITKFKEIRADHIDDKGVVHIDGWRSADENSEGEVIAYIIKAEVYWRDPEFQFDPMVKEAVAEVIAEQQKEQDSLKVKIRKAVSRVVYTADAKPRLTFTDGSPLEEKLSLMESGVNEIMKLL